MAPGHSGLMSRGIAHLSGLREREREIERERVGSVNEMMCIYIKQNVHESVLDIVVSYKYFSRQDGGL